MTYRIPFNRPFMVGKEIDYIAQAVRDGQTAGGGAFTKRCQALMEDRFDARHVLLTTSCTAALEMAAILCECGPDDEVVLPSYTFVSTANAFVLRGARPVFADIRLDTFNLDEGLLKDLITPRTKAVVPVHYGGVACEMDTILEIARAHGVLVIEDAAQGVEARHKGRALGTIGDLGTYSFHETKNVICGEGGALLINDERFLDRAEVVLEKGTDRGRFFRGEVDKYTWVDIGSSFRPSELLAAFLLAQLEEMARITARRGSICERYRSLLAPLVDEGLLRLPAVPADCTPSHHVFCALVEDGDVRRRLIEHCRKRGILLVFHYVPLHTSPMGRKFGYREGMLPATEAVGQRLVRLPLHYELTRAEQLEVARALFGFFGVHGPKDDAI